MCIRDRLRPVDRTGHAVAEAVDVDDLAGRNKIAPDLTGAIDRARNIAAPLRCV